MAVLMATYFNAYPDGHLEDKAQPRRPNAALKPGEAPAGSIESVSHPPFNLSETVLTR